MNEWMQTFIERMQRTFAGRVAFIGLQGSRARGEATPQSDIDVVVVLDALEASDISAYRAALRGLPEQEKICGFLSGRAELAAWERSDLFQFVYDTIPFYGNLCDIVPPPSREDARTAALVGACNIYHGCVHNLLFERDASALYALYKAAGFALRASWFWRTGEYISKTEALARALPEAEARLLAARDQAKALTCDGEAFEALSQLLLTWASEVICALGGANANDT